MNKDDLLDNKLARLSLSSNFNFFTTLINTAIFQLEYFGNELGLKHKRMSTNWQKMSAEKVLPIQERVILQAISGAISKIYKEEEDNRIVDFIRDEYFKPKFGV